MIHWTEKTFKISEYDSLGMLSDYNDFGAFSSAGAAKKELARLAKKFDWSIAADRYDTGMFVAEYYYPKQNNTYLEPCLLRIHYIN